MAKMFYTADEVKTMLGLNDDSLRSAVHDGKLRELHDGPRRVFKASEVEALAAGGPAAGGAAAEPAGQGSSLTLEMADSTAAGVSASAGDTAVTADSVEPSDEDQLTLGGDTAAGAGGGITQAESGPGILQLDGEGSGSGLLDLTREGDDTSLGAVLDEIYPGEQEGVAGSTGLGSGIVAGLGTGLASALTPEEQEAEGVSAEAQGVGYGVDNSYRPFTAVMVPAVILLALALVAVAGVLQGITPAFVAILRDNLLYFLIGSAGVTLIIFVLSSVLSKRGG